MKSFDVAAVVTGGASGLGEATTRALAARGAAVTILDLQEERGQALAAELGGAQRTVGRDGQPHDLGAFVRTVTVNLVGTFNVLRLAAAAMAATEPDEEGERGVVVNTASIAAYDGQIGQ